MDDVQVNRTVHAEFLLENMDIHRLNSLLIVEAQVYGK